MWTLRWVTLLWHGLAVQFDLGSYLRENIYLGSLNQAKYAVIGQPRLFLVGDRHIALTSAYPSLCRAQKQIPYAPSPYMLFPGYAPAHTAFLSVQRHCSFPNGSSKCSKPWRITLNSGDRILRSPFFSFLFTAFTFFFGIAMSFLERSTTILHTYVLPPFFVSVKRVYPLRIR